MKRYPAGQKVIVPGFSFSTASAGIKKPGNRDLALIYSEKPAAAAGVFTTNRIKAAPVKLAMSGIKSGQGQAVIINSGNANACTGARGIRDAEEMVKRTAAELGIPEGLVYVSSTGVIGRPMPMQKIRKAIPGLIAGLSPSSLDRVASAIMTTDTFPKTAFRRIRIGGKTGTMAAVAKGAGMICPNMATMLCFIFTDIALGRARLDAALRKAVDVSFNRISIDNDMSTNDTVMIMSNGMLGNDPLTKSSPLYRKFINSLSELTSDLAAMIVEDGEGATKVIHITVRGARTESDAEKAARAVANSMLVKTAIYGKDPNWGRIISAVGYSGADIDEQKTDIYLNNLKLVSSGRGRNKEEDARIILEDRNVYITINLGVGGKSAGIITSDLTEEYIKINAHYTT